MTATYRMLVTAAVLALAAVFCRAAPPGMAETDVLTAEFGHAEAAPGASVTLPITLTIKPPYHIMANPAGQDLVPTTLTSREPQLELAVTYPPAQDYSIGGAVGAIPVYAGRVTLLAVVKIPPTATPGLINIPATLRYQACNESTCLAPVNVFLPLSVLIREPAITARFGPPVRPSSSAQTVTSAAPTTPAPAMSASPSSSTGGEEPGGLSQAYAAGLLGLLLLVFLNGLALNLTPCTFSLLPVTMGFFAAQAEHRPRRTLPLALLYVLGLCTTFTALGMAAAFAGQQIGLVLQSVWGVALICAVLVLLAASLFGAFEIRVPGRWLALFAGRRGLAGALLMGAAVGLVAAPCVGPFVAALVAFVAGRGDVALGAILFFVLALGLGLPYLVLGMFTGLINRVPRGGGWLVWTKRLLAFPVLALTFYFLQPYLPPALLWSMVALLAVMAAAYLGAVEGRSRRPWSRVFIAARIAAALVFVGLAAAAFTLRALPALRSEAVATAEMPWQPFRDGDLARARIAGAPTVLYFTASWCAYCRNMDEGPFRDREVRAAAVGVRLLKVDITAGLPREGETKELAGRYVHGGPPVLVFFDRRGQVVAERAAVTTSEFLALLQKINSQSLSQ